MSRLSFRPRPLDIHKKLPILKSIKDFEDDNTPSATRTQMLRLVVEANNEAHVVPQTASKKTASSEIPTLEYVIVDTYERDYSSTFNQPTSYLRARGARAEIGEFIEYNLDNEDEDWLEEYNKEGKILPAEKVETIIFKLEVLDHKAREKAGVITPTLGAPIPVLLTFDAAVEILFCLLALQALSIQYGVFQSIYNYWKEKRQRWQKPVLQRLHKQRRENSVQSFEKLRQVRRNLEQAKNLLEAVIRREEKKRDVIDIEVIVQRTQMKYKNETELLEDSLAQPGLPSYLSKFASSEDEFFDSDDIPKHNPLGPHGYAAQNHAIMDSRYVMPSGGGIKREFRRPPVQSSWLHKLDPLEPVLLFTKPLDPAKLAAAGIVPPPASSLQNTTSSRSFNPRGRIGRGGRIIFDRWNPFMHTPIDSGDLFYMPPKPQQPRINHSHY
ncbi:enhancer of polycomb-like protein [Tanacetum coccineum]